MSLKRRLVKTPPGTEYIESTVQPRPVDINDYYTRRPNADTYSGLKPSLKPLKMSNVIRKNSQRDLDVDALEAGHKRIIYIQTFNHVKNEAIVAQPDMNMAKTVYKIPISPQKKKRGGAADDKKKSTISLESQLTISFFKKNNKKFNPQKIIKKKPESIDLRSDENNSAPKDFAFLTGVNIHEGGPPKQDNEEADENEVEEDEHGVSIENPAVLRELQPNSNSYRLDETHAKDADRQKSAKGQSRFPTLKKPSTANSDRPAMSFSEARYKHYMNQKPKMYITAKTNSVQAFGRPVDYKEHLTRVYNKEATPVVPYAWVDHLGPRKDYKKAILDSYLAQFNLEALKYIDEDLYEYAKENAS